ncbi:hypothetical protein DL95DRAFT_280618, partial [Leptodontidium sp. 2 PMI_412]
INNIRGREHLFTLDNCGFETGKWKFDEEWLVDEVTVQTKYCPAAEDFMKSVLGAARVVIFDWLVRKNTPLLEDRRFKKQLRPALNVHIDQIPGAAEQRVRYLMDDETEELLKRRYQIANLWRLIIRPVEDWPLAVCDYRTLRPQDAIHADTVGRGPYVGESAYIKAHEGQGFWYIKHQVVDEVWLLKQYDSYAAIPEVSPHTPFDDPQAPANARPRESIELRALAF